MQIKGRCIQLEHREPHTGIATLKFFEYETQKEIYATGVIATPEKNTQYTMRGTYRHDGIFYFGHIRKWSSCRKESIGLLSTHVSGITEKTAEQIVDLLGDDIYSYIEIEDLSNQLMQIPGIGEKKAQTIINYIKEGTDENDTFQFLVNYQVPYSSILEVLKENPPLSSSDIIKRPYKLQDYGVDFEICDTVAIKNHIDPWDFARIHAVIKKILKQIQNRGDTRMEKAAFIKAAARFSKIKGKSTISIPIELVELIMYSAKYMKIYTVGETEYVSSTELFLHEQSITRNIKRLQMSKKTVTDHIESIIAEIENEEQVSYNKEQKKVFEILKTGGIALLLGGPGTGKTTVINGVIKALLKVKPDCQILLCAPTGRAAVRMTELSNKEAKTMHKAMNLKWFNHDVKLDPLDYDCIIVDEMSMCDTELFSFFTQSVTSGTIILLSGDYNQIPSVGPGQVFKDLVESEEFTTYRLVEIIRQKEDSLIVRNAKAVLDGEELKTGPDFQVAIVENDNTLQRLIANASLEQIPQILCPIKKTKSGVWELNQVVQSKYQWTDRGVWIDGICFHENDKVLMNENNYDVGYMNGDIGQIKSIRDGCITIAYSDKVLNIALSDTGKMTLSYALTFHKSQGGECEEILIVLPEGAKGMASRELLYTAVTRAKKKVKILAVGDILNCYLAAEGRNNRNTGLKDSLVGNISIE